MIKRTFFLRCPIILLLLFLTGCIAYPAKGLRRCGIQGKLIDNTTGNPLSEKEICVAVNDETFHLKTSKSGTFKISPDYEWYLTWTLSGPVMAPYPLYEVEISTFAYDKIFLFSSFLNNIDCPDNYIEVPFQTSEDYLNLGNQSLGKHIDTGN